MSHWPTLPRRVRIEFTDEKITPLAGTHALACAAARLRLPQQLAEAVHVKQRHRGASDAEMLLSVIYSLATGDGDLYAVQRLAADAARRDLTGLARVPDHRRVSEYLARFDRSHIAALLGVVREIVVPVAVAVMQHQVQERGYLPLFMDGSGIEVSGKCFEGANVGYNGKRQLWLHQVYLGPLWASQRLNEGGGSVIQGWQEQLEQDIVPLIALLPAGTKVWAKMDNAYYNGALVDYLQHRGWDYSISVTHAVYQAPLERIATKLPEESWEKLDEEGREEAAWIRHWPAGWERPQEYVVLRSFYDAHGRRMLFPRYSYILTSLSHRTRAEVVSGHREKQGHENWQKGPLTELDLHHPPCQKLMANQTFYTLGQIAHLLLLAVQYGMLPKVARSYGIRTILRDVIRVAGQVTYSGHRWLLKLAKTALRLDWLVYLAACLDPGGSPERA